MKKLYQITDEHSAKKAIRFTVDEKSKTVVFDSKNKDGILLFETEDKKVQEAIEKSSYFENETITCVSKTNSTPSTPAKTSDDDDSGTAVFEEVTTFAAAKEVLRNEPYNVPLSAMPNYKAFKAKADELGVSFPNLKTKMEE